MGRGRKPAKSKKAKPAVARELPKNNGSRVRDLEKRLAEALRDKAEALEQLQTSNRELAEAREQQTVTSEILRVISSSPTDVQRVLDAVAENATRLCGATDALIYRVEAGMILRVAHFGPVPSVSDTRPVTRETVTGRSIIERRAIHVHDLVAELAHGEYAETQNLQGGIRTVLCVPLTREDSVLGAITIRRTQADPFTEPQIELLKTFANQAVIAIENVRLFTETKEALEQQTATSDILRVISASPTDIQPVVDSIAAKALDLCQAKTGAVFRFDGELISVVAAHSFSPEAVEAHRQTYPVPPGRGGATPRAILSRAVAYIPDVREDPEYEHQALATATDYLSALSVPMLHEGEPVGAITVTRAEAGAFSQRQIELLKTFADQAVIAIENVRLFTELQEKNKALTEAHAQITEALDQQTATSEILRVISSSPTDLQPVFDTIVRSAMQLCSGMNVGVSLVRDGTLHHPANYGGSPEALATIRGRFPRPLDMSSSTGVAILTRSVCEVPDVEDPSVLTFTREAGRILGSRSFISVPMLREGEAIGAITVTRREPGRFSDREIALLQTFADQAVIAIENVRLFTELQEKNLALTEAHAQVTESLQQQTATSEVLKVISRSAFDLEPVFETLAENVVRLCEARRAFIFRFDGEFLRMGAAYNASPEVREFMERNPTPVGRGTASGRAALERRTVHIPDVQADPEYRATWTEVEPIRTILGVPMLKGDELLGVIVTWKREVKPFTEKQIALVETFAAQAVIAIENVRLFNETKEALERQTATAEILKVISSSPTDVQPVFDTIAENAWRLCAATRAAVYRFDGGLVHFVAHHGYSAEALAIARGLSPSPPDRNRAATRAIVDRTVVHIPDVLTDPEHRHPDLARAVGVRSLLGVPMLRNGEPLGAVFVGRGDPGTFSEGQINLLKAFADQAVIAIENVRLFTELEARNRDLTTALDRQTATAELLRVISQAQTDVQPVFETIADSAVRLLRGWGALVFRYDGELIHLVAARGGRSGTSEAALSQFQPRPPIETGMLVDRAISTRTIQHVVDIEAESWWAPLIRENARVRGWRSNLIVPMMSGDEILGVFGVSRAEPGGFSPAEITLLTTFADQAVIAIKNARLLDQLQTRTAQLSRSVDELTALGEVSRALSSTLNLETVLQTIVLRADELASTAGCTIWEYDEPRAEFRLRASHYADQADAALLQAPGRTTTIPKGQGVTTQAMEQRQPVQIHDITAAHDYESPIRRPLVEAGHRALLGVPLLSEDEVIGVLAVTRKTPGEFEPEVVRLLSTFATQSALAIQNARLFREIEEKSRQLEIASQHKSEFLANMSHELRTPLNAIIGFSEVLSERMFGELNEKQEEYSKDIHASGQHLLSLINDILDLSKIEAGRMELEMSDFHLPTALDNALTLVRERAGRRGIALHMNVDNRLGHIEADERKVRQVVLNLLSNAIKFTPEGGQIEVRAEPRDGLVEVSVSDTGVGIAPEDQEAVFEEFRQVGTADKKVEGTGLGLTLCRKFVELHGGRIWVKSQVGAGSTFTFTIPASADKGRTENAIDGRPLT